MTGAAEAGATFACFGSTCAVYVIGEGARGTPQEAVAFARARLREWHGRFSRFDPHSELSRLNADQRPTVSVSWELARLAAAAVAAAELTGGLVDATLVDELVAAGYDGDLPGSIELVEALALAPPRRPAAGRTAWRRRELVVDIDLCTVTRPAGCTLDSGGLGKGLFADLLAEELATHAAFAVDCAGDLRLGGTAATIRDVLVASPFDARPLHTFALAGGGVATSGIGRRSWRGPDGASAHHLLDPSTGLPAFTGIAQVTALAPTALEAEIRAKAAILSGPERAREWLTGGGVIVGDDAGAEVVSPPGRGRHGPQCTSR